MPVKEKQKRKKIRELKCGSFTLRLGERTLVMGILNRTPDSFSDGGEFMAEDEALRRIEEMRSAGADLIDIGGESSRPGSAGVGPGEEMARVMPIVEKVARDIPVSVDTRKSEVARQALSAGAVMINDISGLRHDPEMAGVIAGYGALVCVMHMKGTPRDMQNNPSYGDLMPEVIGGLRESINIALRSGIDPDKIIVDPGIGFGKTALHNLIILNRLVELAVLDKPVMIGTSRKSFIGAVLQKGVSARLAGTAASCALAIANGADIIRVHDTDEMRDVARVTDAVLSEEYAF